MPDPVQDPKKKSEFLIGLRNGAVLAAVALAVGIPWLRSRQAEPPAAP
ncbi:MAG: hypothetical protein JWP65_2143, partial [Ramlibacter sp.]|nr:hypothetical protein [Ramlibacter sp.]